MSWFTIVLYSLSVIFVGLCDTRDSFTIGGLFHKEDYQTALAFKYAVEFQNMYNNYDTHFNVQIKIIPREDTFEISKIVCNMTDSPDGLVAIIGPGSSQAAEIVESICTKLEIPHLQINWKSNFQPRPTVINFYPDTDLLGEAFAMLVENMNWKNYMILYESDHSLIRLQDVLKVANVDNRPVMIRQFEEGVDQRSLLKRINDMQVINIILDCQTEKILDILQQAKDVDLLNGGHSFLLTSLDAHTLDFESLNTYANITCMRLLDPKKFSLQAAVRNWELGEAHVNRPSSFLATEVETAAALTHDAATLLIESVNELEKTQRILPRPMSCYDTDTWEAGYRLCSYMRKHPLNNGTSGPIIFDEEGKRTRFTLEVIEIRNGEQTQTATWDSWNSSHFQSSFTGKAQQTYVFRTLHDGPVVVASTLLSPYLRERDQSDGPLEGNHKYEGFSKDILDLLAEKLNFTYSFKIVVGGGKFVAAENKWNGVVGEVKSGEATLGICDLTITRERREVVDFSTPFMTLGIGILHKKSSVYETENMFGFMAPLDVEVWLYTVTIFLSATLTMYVITRMSPDDWENPHPCDEHPTELENIWTFKNCFWFTLGSFMAQGCDLLPKSVSSRMSAAMWWFFCLLITESYKAILVPFLTQQSAIIDLQNAEVMSKQSKVKFGLMKDGSTESFFRNSNFPTFKDLWTQMQSFEPSVFEVDSDAGVKKVLAAKNRGYAFFMESSTLEYEAAKHCELMRVGPLLDFKEYGIAMPLNAPFRTYMDELILAFQQDGRLSSLRDKWWYTKNPPEPCPPGYEEAPDTSGKMDISQLGGVFIVLGVGVSIALFIAIGEFLWEVRTKSVEEHITFFQALKLEVKFVLKVWETKKQAKAGGSETTSLQSHISQRSQRSRSRNRSRSRRRSGRRITC